MPAINFKQGEDIKISLEVKENGSNVDVSTAPKIKCVFKDKAGLVVKKYSLTEETDYGFLEVDSVNDYQVNIFVQRSESLTFPTGLLKATLIVAFVDATFPEGERTKEYPFTIGFVSEGQAKDENMNIP